MRPPAPHLPRLALVAPLALLALAAIAPRAPAAPIPRFTEFGWLAPPPSFTDSSHVADYAGAGLDLLLPAWRDSGLVADTRTRLDLARDAGLAAIAWDRRLRQVNPQDPATWAVLDSIVADLGPHPALLGYYLGDEPTPDRFRQIGEFFALLGARDPGHPAWNNLLGRGAFATRAEWLDYTTQYVTVAHPSILCNDEYDLLVSGDRGLLVENVRGLADVARAAGVPFWGVIQVVAHASYRAPGDGELRWQVATWLAYGARGIGWFSYWTPDADPRFDWQPAIVDTVGNRTPLYARVRAIAAETRDVGLELAGLAWRRTQYAGSLPSAGDPFAPDSLVTGVLGRLALSTFADSLGRDLRLVANSDSLRAQEVGLVLARGARVRIERLDPLDRVWEPLAVCGRPDAPEVRMVLDSGAFTLLRFTPAARGPGWNPLSLAARPNPAHGAVEWLTAGCESGDRIVIRDALGRRVRTLAVPGDGAPLTWHGERDDGGRAPAGVYFARLGEGERAVTRRLVWSPGR